MGKTVKGACKYKGCKDCTPDSCPGARRCLAYKHAQDKDYSDRHKERKHNYDVKRFQENKETMTADHIDYAKNHWSKIVASNTLRNHRSKGYKVLITLKETEALFDNTTTCRYCGRLLGRGQGVITPMTPSLDRKDNSLTLTKDNVQVICNECNITKGARSHEEFVAYMKRVLELNT